VPPITLNFLRWALAFLLLLPFAWRLLRAAARCGRAGAASRCWACWGVGCYNALQYLALKTSTPLNVTLVAASTPAFMLGIGALSSASASRAPGGGRGAVDRRRAGGAERAATGTPGAGALRARRLLHAAGHRRRGRLQLAAGAARRSARDPRRLGRLPDGADGAGLAWSGLFAAGEWAADPAHPWGWPLAAALAYVAIGPAILAYRSWGLGVQRVGPNIAGFFSNLTPLFAA
jgi:drug/metabolite transporter (DMT)-like permease